MVLKKEVVGYIELVITSIIWGVSFVLMKFALFFLSPQEIAFSRFLITSILFIPLLFFFREKYTRSEILKLLILALTGVLLYQLLFLWGENGLSAGDASFIGSFEPIFIAILSISLKQDRFSPTVIAGMAVSTIGLVVLLKPNGISSEELFSAFLVLMSALAWGVYTFVGRDMLTKHNPLNVTGFVSLIGTLMLLPFTLSGLPAIFAIRNPDLILSLLFIGVLATFLGYILWFQGLKYVRPTTGGTTLFITPFVTVLVAYALISEPISLTTVLGGTTILIGLAVSGVKGGNK